MARVRFILALYLALILVVLPISAAWSSGPSSSDPNTKGNVYTHGGVAAGHPWDDGPGGSPSQPGGTSASQGTKGQVQQPPIVPALTSGGGKWVGEALIYLWQKVTHAKISQKAQYCRHK